MTGKQLKRYRKSVLHMSQQQLSNTVNYSLSAIAQAEQASEKPISERLKREVHEIGLTKAQSIALKETYKALER